jgi:L-methionine (R)-S-oxide reductase
MAAITYDDILDTLRERITRAQSHHEAMVQVVNTLKDQMPHYSWVGIYLLEGNELVLGPFVGKPSPHTRIPLDKGICGAAASQGLTIVVDDVDLDPRYLACSLETRSEIVVPIRRGDRLIGEIDVDSDKKAAFGDADRDLLEATAALIGAKFPDR